VTKAWRSQQRRDRKAEEEQLAAYAVIDAPEVWTESDGDEADEDDDESFFVSFFGSVMYLCLGWFPLGAF